MDTSTLLETYKDALSQDSALSTWANTNYGKTHQIFVGVNSNNPPAESECPYLAIYPASKTIGLGSDNKSDNVVVVCAVSDETFVTNPEQNVTEFTGIQRLEAYRKLALEALVAANIGNAQISVVKIGYEPLDYFPMMIAGMEIEVIEGHVTGGDPWN